MESDRTTRRRLINRAMDEFIVISILWLGLGLGLGLVGFRNVVLNTLYRSTCILGLAPEKLFTLFHNFPFKTILAIN